MGINDFDIDKLLKPYQHGGTTNSRVKRTLGTIVTKLIIANRLPPDAVGMAVWSVFHEIAYEGLEFKGTAKYGSKGRELFCCIRDRAIQYTQKQTTDLAMQKILIATGCVKQCPMRSKKMIKQTKLERFKTYMLKPRGHLWRF